jgi:hypothetical protein
VQVAIKKLNVLSMTEKELYEFRHEVTLMKYDSRFHHHRPPITTNEVLTLGRALPAFCLIVGQVPVPSSQHRRFYWYAARVLVRMHEAASERFPLALTIAFPLVSSRHQGRAQRRRISVWSPSTMPTEA